MLCLALGMLRCMLWAWTDKKGSANPAPWKETDVVVFSLGWTLEYQPTFSTSKQETSIINIWMGLATMDEWLWPYTWGEGHLYVLLFSAASGSVSVGEAGQDRQTLQCLESSVLESCGKV